MTASTTNFLYTCTVHLQWIFCAILHVHVHVQYSTCRYDSVQLTLVNEGRFNVHVCIYTNYYMMTLHVHVYIYNNEAMDWTMRYMYTKKHTCLVLALQVIDCQWNVMNIAYKPQPSQDCHYKLLSDSWILIYRQQSMEHPGNVLKYIVRDSMNVSI